MFYDSDDMIPWRGRFAGAKETDFSGHRVNDFGADPRRIQQPCWTRFEAASAHVESREGLLEVNVKPLAAGFRTLLASLLH